jgi:hypothetical protein
MANEKSIYDGLGAALQKTDGSSKAAYEVLLKHFGGGVLQGLEALAEFAASDETNMTAMSAEKAALSVSRRIVAPVLQEKLQSRVDAIEKGSKKKRPVRVVK